SPVRLCKDPFSLFYSAAAFRPRTHGSGSRSADASQFTDGVQGNTALQTREPKRRLELPMVARFAKAASDPPLRRKVRSSAPAPRLTTERYVPPCLHPVGA